MDYLSAPCPRYRHQERQVLDGPDASLAKGVCDLGLREFASPMSRLHTVVGMGFSGRKVMGTRPAVKKRGLNRVALLHTGVQTIRRLARGTGPRLPRRCRPCVAPETRRSFYVMSAHNEDEGRDNKEDLDRLHYSYPYTSVSCILDCSLGLSSRSGTNKRSVEWTAGGVRADVGLLLWMACVNVLSAMLP